MQELSILDYPLVHHPAPIKAAAALLSAVSFHTKTLRPYLDEIKVPACSHNPQAPAVGGTWCMLCYQEQNAGGPACKWSADHRQQGTRS